MVKIGAAGASFGLLIVVSSRLDAESRHGLEVGHSSVLGGSRLRMNALAVCEPFGYVVALEPSCKRA